MSEEKLSLGQAIDQIITALSKLEESSQAVALDAVCRHLKISFGIASNSIQTQQTLTQQPEAPVNPINPQPRKDAGLHKGQDIRSLKETKQPKSAQQMACIVAYYLTEIAIESERKESISSSDLEKYFKQAGFKLPEDISQVLKNGKKGGYFESVERGNYKLTAVGYNLVAHNPDAGSPWSEVEPRLSRRA